MGNFSPFSLCNGNPNFAGSVTKNEEVRKLLLIKMKQAFLFFLLSVLGKEKCERKCNSSFNNLQYCFF